MFRGTQLTSTRHARQLSPQVEFGLVSSGFLAQSGDCVGIAQDYVSEAVGFDDTEARLCAAFRSNSTLYHALRPDRISLPSKSWDGRNIQVGGTTADLHWIGPSQESTGLRTKSSFRM